MRFIFVLIGLLLAAFHLSAQSPGTLSGTITDSASGKPMAGVSVFLNNTSRGTVTRTDGNFLLEIPRGNYQLIISAIGYETRVIDINGSRLPSFLHVGLHPRATELQSVTVEPYLKNGWAQWGRFFLDNFIGTTENASSCTIRNRDVLKFHFSKKNNRLTVTADEPLVIENTALGYILQYRLELFASDFRSHIVTFYGYPYFLEMTTTRESRHQRWLDNRRLAYTGSMMHFMRCLYAGSSIEKGFVAQQQVTLVNEEKLRIKSIYRPDFQKMGTYPMDTLYHFWEVLRQPDQLTRNLIVPPDSLMTTYADQTKSFFFTGKLLITYGVNTRNENYRESELQLVTPAMIMVEENGNYYPPQEILTGGFWARSEKISNLLPLDYSLTSPEIRTIDRP